MKALRKYLIFHLVAVCLTLSQFSRADGLRPVHSKHAMVVSVHGEASRAGISVMHKGGNAVDAAVATGFALAVVHPAAGNIGGGGFMLVRMANGEIHFLDYREKAPKSASRDMYLDEKGNEEAQSMQRDKYLEQFPDSKRIFQRNGQFYQPGEIFRQPELARTLQRIAANPDDFYKGAMAHELAAEMNSHGGLITAEDMAAYEVKERPPVRGSYRGYEIISAPPPSSGGVTLLETLNILEGYNLGRFGNRSADSIHLTVEAFRRAFYDRAEFLGDPDFSQLPVPQLIDKKYADAWRSSLDMMRSSGSKELRRPSGFGELDRQAALHGPYAGPEPENTTHYSVVDAQGNAVAVTTTLNDGFGARVTAGKLGFLLNDEMDDFTSKPGVPNGYGLIQGEANSIAPGKRPLSAMAPTIVLKDGKLFLVLGSPGGPRIISTVANILMGVVDYGLDIQQAVNAARFHHQWEPDELYMERVGISPDTIKLLEARGHKVKAEGYWSDGECIAIDPKTEERLGAPDGRNGGKAAWY